MKSIVQSTSAHKSSRGAVATQRTQSSNRSAPEMSLVEGVAQVLGNTSRK